MIPYAFYSQTDETWALIGAVLIISLFVSIYWTIKGKSNGKSGYFPMPDSFKARPGLSHPEKSEEK